MLVKIARQPVRVSSAVNLSKMVLLDVIAVKETNF